jgi:hypothetical protein
LERSTKTQTAASVQESLAATFVKTIAHPPYLPVIAPANFFLFQRAKSELIAIFLSGEGFKTSWEGIYRCIAKDEFASAFRRWIGRCKKCVRIGGNQLEKQTKRNYLKNYHLFIIIILLLFIICLFISVFVDLNL